MAAEIASWGDISALGYKDAASGKNLKYCPSKSKIIAENISLNSTGNNYANARLVPKNYVLNPTNSESGLFTRIVLFIRCKKIHRRIRWSNSY